MFTPEFAYLYPRLTLVSLGRFDLFSKMASSLLYKLTTEMSHAISIVSFLFDRKCFLIRAGILLLNFKPSLLISLWRMFVVKWVIRFWMPISALRAVVRFTFALSIFPCEKRTLFISFYRFFYSTS